MGVLPVPAGVRAILLDVEGTTTPIAFVQVRGPGRGGIGVLGGGFGDLGDVSGFPIRFLATLVIRWAPGMTVGFRSVGGLEGWVRFHGFGWF